MKSTRYPAPSAWARSSRGGANANYLQVTGLNVKYVGPGQEDQQAASIQADHPVPADYGLYLFEVKVVSKGKEGFIGVGFNAPDVALDRLPGWENHSYGYHGDDGFAFTSNSGKGQKYGPLFGTGDVIGAILNRVEKTISFTKNGVDLGTAFSNVQEEVLFPTVGMRTPNEHVLANFGSSPFTSDLASLHKDALQQIQTQICATTGPLQGKVSNIMGELVFDYLRHEGLLETAAVVANEVLGDTVQVSEAHWDRHHNQRAILKAVEAGNVDEAMTLAEAAAPGVLAAPKHCSVSFQLKILKFIELVRCKQDETAIAYGKAELSRAVTSAADQEDLQDALSLLAYDVPETSPCGNLLSQSHREHLASKLAAAVAMHQGCNARSALHQLLCHTASVHEELLAVNNPAASLIEMHGQSGQIAFPSGSRIS